MNMKNIKEFLIDEYFALGSPISLKKFNSKYKKELSNVGCLLSETPLLDGMSNLTLEQAYELVEYYGKDFLFLPDIEENIYDYMVTRRKLDIIENQKLGKE